MEKDKSKASELSYNTNDIVTGINSTVLILLLYNEYRLNDMVTNIDNQFPTVLRNVNMVNLQLKKWISYFVHLNIENEKKFESLKKVITSLEARISKLEEKS